MESADVTGLLEFESIVIKGKLLEDGEANELLAAEDWTFAEVSEQNSGSRHSKKASQMDIEGEVVFVDVEEDDIEVDVEGDEPASVSWTSGNTEFLEDGGVSCNIVQSAKVADRQLGNSSQSTCTSGSPGVLAFMMGDSEGGATCPNTGSSLLPTLAGTLSWLPYSCGKTSKRKTHPLVHGKLICDFCGQYFPDGPSLWRHSVGCGTTIHEKPFKCSVCGKNVKCAFALKKHKRQHVQAYLCDVCGESFHRASGLQIHKYLHVR